MTSSGSRPGEFALIAEVFAPLASARGAFGLTDDAATLPSRAGKEIVATTDALVGGVHFLDNDPPDTIAKKALRVNLSDLAAKGATPHGYLLALSLPARIDLRWLRAFARGLAEDQKHFAVSLLGGDTTSTGGPLTIAVTAFGYVGAGRMIRRAGARPGDLVFVTGSIGDAGGGLRQLKKRGGKLSHAVRDHLLHRYRVPQPRTSLGPLLVGVASAALDVSDGLVADLGHIAQVSRVLIAIDAFSVPRSAALRAEAGDGEVAVIAALTAGDDYEIAFTASPRHEPRIRKAAARSGVPVSRIGRVSKGRGVVVLDASGRAISVPEGGWTHF